MTKKEHHDFSRKLFMEKGKSPPDEEYLDELWEGLCTCQAWPFEFFEALTRKCLPTFEKAARAINN